MDWLLHADTTTEKLLVMVVAILLFVVLMGVILFAVDRPKNPPRWIVTVGFLGPAILLIVFGLVYPGLRTIYSSFFDRNGDNFVGFDNYVKAFTQDAFQQVLTNTALWVVLVPLVATSSASSTRSSSTGRGSRSSPRSLIFLPMAISMVGASIIWKFVYEFRPARAGHADRAAQPGPRVARPRPAAVPPQRSRGTRSSSSP